MKKLVLLCLAAALAVTFSACGGGDLKTGPSGNPGQTKISFQGGVVRVTNAYADNQLFFLVSNDGEVKSMPEGAFTKFVLTGDYEKWRALDVYTVNYAGGPNVAVSGMRSGDKVNGYFRTPDGKAFWLDLGKAECVSGCKIVFEVEHDRHTIHLF